MTGVHLSGNQATNTFIFAESTFKRIAEYAGYRYEETGTYTYDAPKLTITLGNVTKTGVVTEST